MEVEGRQAKLELVTQLEREEREWWRDVDRTREKRGALATLRK